MKLRSEEWHRPQNHSAQLVIHKPFFCIGCTQKLLAPDFFPTNNNQQPASFQEPIHIERLQLTWVVAITLAPLDNLDLGKQQHY